MMNQPNSWILTVAECQQNEAQFVSLQPIGGLISGDQARTFFLKSGLSPNILAQIWHLSDMNKDGKLDRLEFFIALRLVRNCLAGIPLPPVLPDSLKHFPGAPMQIPQHQMPQLPPRPMSAYGGSTLPANFGSVNAQLYASSNASFSGQSQTPTIASTAPPFIMGIKELGDWSIPQHLKLRFSQQFNQLDKNRVGVLTGVQARGVLGESKLPTNVLAQIWTMSDVNKDGCLSIEEFCVAMHLIEMVKSGFALPNALPPELNLFCHRSKTASPQVDPSMPPPQKHGPLKTFEDKRRDNLDRGQAELERRRQILREEEDRRRAEIERKEREAEERRERERQELEKKREAEREAERQQELERERERAAEEERLKAEREELRKRLEQERLKELEKVRIRDLENQYQSELEKTTQFQQRHKTMTFQLQAMEERSQQLNSEITEARDEIIGITSEIEKMRESRDQKLARINELQTKSQQLAVQCERLSHENLQLQTECQKTFCRSQEIENLKKEIAEKNQQIELAEEELREAKMRLENQEKQTIEKRPEYEASKAKLRQMLGVYNKLVDKFQGIRTDAQQRLKAKRKMSQPKDSITDTSAPGFKTAFGSENPQDLYAIPPDAYNNRSSSAAFDSTFTPNFAAAFSTTNSGSTFQPDGPSGFESAFVPSSNVSGAESMGVAEHTKSTVTATNATTATVRYRALFEFVARSDDELSLQPGDVILVFQHHTAEPGWLAGQIKDKVGWFPAAFAEPITASATGNNNLVKKNSTSSITTSPSAEPLESIKEDPAAEKEFATDFGAAFAGQQKPCVNATNAVAAQTTINGTASAVLTTNSALYDSPPGLDGTTTLSGVEKSKVVDPNETVIGVGTALYQWKARNDTELSFSRNDCIEILEQAEMRWRGRLQKKPEVQGWFPKSYVKMMSSDTSATTETNTVTSSGTTTTKLSDNAKQKSMESATSTTNPASNKGLTKSASGLSVVGDENGGGEWYVAIYQFDAVEPTDLSLKPGDLILVTEARDEWWKGTCNGKAGIFPANYVQKTSSATETAPLNAGETVGRAMAAFEATAANQISLRVGDLVRIHNTSPGGWWEGELNRDGVKQSGWFPGNYIQVLNGAVGVDNNVATAPTGTSSSSTATSSLTLPSKATAIFDYVAQHSDELSFKAGDVIEVVEHVDAQWWKGRKDGGDDPCLLFPSNFVQPMV